MLDRLTPRIIELQSQNRNPITVYIDSRGGSTAVAAAIRRLLAASNVDQAPPCRIITVVTTYAASAAADLLSFGDYAIAHQDAAVLYHGIRYSSVNEPLTFERASWYTESIKWGNEIYAIELARQSVPRLVFLYATMRSRFNGYRTRRNNHTMGDMDCFTGLLSEQLSDSAKKALTQALERNTRYQRLVNYAFAKARRSKKFTAPKRHADFESAVLKGIIDFERSNNKGEDWTFYRKGLAQLNDDFLLLVEWMTNYDSDELKAICNRWWNFFLTDTEKQELLTISDVQQRELKKFARMKAILRPVWLFLVALCHTLQEGDNELTAKDARWLGLIDEAIGMSEVDSLRSIAEWDPEPEPATLEPSTQRPQIAPAAIT